MVDDQIKQLAETLKNHGLAASMLEAMEKASSILNAKAAPQGKNLGMYADFGIDAENENVPLNELMKEEIANVKEEPNKDIETKAKEQEEKIGHKDMFMEEKKVNFT